MANELLTPMNHREIEYEAKKLPEIVRTVPEQCDIPDSFNDNLQIILDWLEETGKQVFDEDLVMDYGTDCLRLYLMFEKTPKEHDAPFYGSWQEGALEGLYKFLGRYRRMILAADEWNRRGNYSDGRLTDAGIGKMNLALEETAMKISQCASRGNTDRNRHNIVAALMELLNILQKELRTGEIITALHDHAVRTAVPYGEKGVSTAEEASGSGSDIGPLATPSGCGMRASMNVNPQVTAVCRSFIILMSPFAPDLSKVLWLQFK